MLRELKITNLALIEELNILFDDGLIVLTGETGAGKSIILQAIHLLTGGKAAATWVRSGADMAVVEALFEVSSERSTLQEDISEMGFDADEDLIIKRVIYSKGKSRYYINGSLATAKLVGEVVENLLSVASQHDHQQLLVPRYHLDFIDAVGNLWSEREKMSALYDQWSSCRVQYRELQQKETDKEQRRDFLEFQCKEIEEAAITLGEDESLAVERDRLKASGDLIRLGQQSYKLLAGSVTNALSEARKNLEKMAEFDQSLSGLSEKVAGHSYELEDHTRELRSYLDTIPNDPSQLETIVGRINVLQQLKRKYGGSLEEVLAYAEKSRQELSEIDALDERLNELSKELAEHEKEMLKQASTLSADRRKMADQLAEKIHSELKSLCFEQAQFEIHFNGSENPGIDTIGRLGWDKPEFMFSANPGEPVKPLAKVASGGELSRLMLSLKCLLARKDQVETVIFDEIDAGISGKTAEAVARKIKELADHHQVLCITHLPQIASYADEHFLVVKNVVDQRTHTSISQLPQESRIGELARMLDGDSVTSQTLAYAQELIERNK